MQTININSKTDIERIIRDELEKKFKVYDRMINKLYTRIIDLERIMGSIK